MNVHVILSFNHNFQVFQNFHPQKILHFLTLPLHATPPNTAHRRVASHHSSSTLTQTVQTSSYLLQNSSPPPSQNNVLSHTLPPVDNTTIERTQKQRIIVFSSAWLFRSEGKLAPSCLHIKRLEESCHAPCTRCVCPSSCQAMAIQRQRSLRALVENGLRMGRRSSTLVEITKRFTYFTTKRSSVCTFETIRNRLRQVLQRSRATSWSSHYFDRSHRDMVQLPNKEEEEEERGRGGRGRK